MTRLIVCDTCAFSPDEKTRDGRTGGEMLADLARAAAADGPVEVATTACLMGCEHSCNVALQSPGKPTYVLGAFRPTQEAASALLDYAAKYDASDTGRVPYREWPTGVKGHFVARIPPVET